MKEGLKNEELEEKGVEMEGEEELEESDYDKQKPASQPKTSVGKQVRQPLG